MMFRRVVIFGFLLILLQGCSSNRPQENGASEAPAEDKSASSENTFQSTLTVEANPVEAEIAKDLSHLIKKDIHQKVKSKRSPSSASMAEFGDMGAETDDSPKSGHTKSRKYKPGKMKYKVAAGDTLMKISFKAFADPFRWKEIYEDNKDKIQNPNLLVKGSIFSLRCAQFAQFRRNGNPYLIRPNDTLSKISLGLYGTMSKWPSIWKNNPELITNPNKIYSGFTLYYLSKDKVK